MTRKLAGHFIHGDVVMKAKLSLRSLYIWLGIGILFLGAAISAIEVRHVRQGLTIVMLKATGSLPGISWEDLYRMGRPGNRHFGLPSLAETRNPYATIKDPYIRPSDLAAGGQIFRTRCATCHGSDGSGGPGGPSLQGRQMTHGGSDWALFRTITYGIRGTAMPSHHLPWVERWQLVAYVRSLMLRGKPAMNTAAESPARKLEPVRYESILAAAQHQDEWPTYSGSYNGQRFSPLSKITPANVAGLQLLWMRQYDTSDRWIETSPLVVDGYMFVTVPPNRVEALDAKTGKLIWSYNRKLPQHLSLCCGFANRGLAVLGHTLFLGTLDAHLVALDIGTGKVRWDVEIADYRKGYSITGAPLALKNLVITGVAGGEFGIRGFVDARDAATGKEVWRFYTVPKPGEPGAKTWAGDSWKTGGAPTWMTGSFDPKTNVIYWPTGNPSPDLYGEGRQGDNLYSNSVLALDADHGTLRWYFQFMPHGLFDWDATEPLILFDKGIGGRRKYYLAQADRNGFYYLLNRKTGRLILARQFINQNWSDRFDSNGRPVINPAAHPTEQGTFVYPGLSGATNWVSSSYSPLTGLIYIPTWTHKGTYFERRPEFHVGEIFMGGSFLAFSGVQSDDDVVALNALTGKQQWVYQNHGYFMGGLLSTGGGIVFGSRVGRFFALNAETGHELWHVTTSGIIHADPITFMCDGKQMVTIAAAHDILTFGF